MLHATPDRKLNPNILLSQSLYFSFFVPRIVYISLPNINNMIVSDRSIKSFSFRKTGSISLLCLLSVSSGQPPRREGSTDIVDLLPHIRQVQSFPTVAQLDRHAEKHKHIQDQNSVIDEIPSPVIGQHTSSEITTSASSFIPSTAAKPLIHHINESGFQSVHQEQQQHEHGFQQHSHLLDQIPDASAIPDSTTIFLTLPAFQVQSGHSHAHGSSAPKPHLDEQAIFRSKGPDPLSYREWDFNVGLGRAEILKAFIKAEDARSRNETSTKVSTMISGRHGNHGQEEELEEAPMHEASALESPLISVVNGRWRRLFDEKDMVVREKLYSDLSQKLGVAGSVQTSRHSIILILHVLTSILSCFVLLPVALFLRAANSRFSAIVAFFHFAMLLVSHLLARAYRSMSPKLYPSNSHSGLGWLIFWISILTLGGDVLSRTRFVAVWYADSSYGSWGRVWKSGMKGRFAAGAEHELLAEEEEMLRSEQAEEDAELTNLYLNHHVQLEASTERVDLHEDNDEYATAAISGNSGPRSHSRSSTLVNSPQESDLSELELNLSDTENQEAARRNLRFWGSSQKQNKHKKSGVVSDPESSPSLLSRVGRYSRVVLARSLPILAFSAAYTGVAVYTGSCRGAYKNVCLAHGIKGGIFLWYGLFSFSRYLGAYAALGWAWNRRPKAKSSPVSAEWVECLVIFIYGSTNMWMERFGSKAGDPYTVKQVQHISIAVMFAFAGAAGLLLETSWIRTLLNFPVALSHPESSPIRSVRDASSRDGTPGERGADALIQSQTAPPSYSGSFNPFPALVVGITGVAMAAHHQDYVYEVSIHSLWGMLLAGFSVLRCLTYFFLWLRPPSSVLPSHPPTEALASFSLSAGGLTFLLSSEEVSFAFMRSGYDDIMAVLNLVIAVISLVFFSLIGLMAIKGAAERFEYKRSREITTVLEMTGSRGSPRFKATNRSESTLNKKSPHRQPILVLEEEEGEHHDRRITRSPDLDTCR